MEQSAEIHDLAAALSAFQAEVSEPRKDATNPHLRNRFVSLTSAWAAIRPVLGKHGLSVVQLAGGGGDLVTVTTQLQHASGQWLREVISLPVTPQKGLNDAQVMGSALSYLRRYALLAVLGLSAEDDDAASAQANDSQRGGAPQTDPLVPWRQRLAACDSADSLAQWIAAARSDLNEAQRARLGAALRQRAKQLGTNIGALAEAS